jgi:hypothetical protein
MSNGRQTFVSGFMFNHQGKVVLMQDTSTNWLSGLVLGVTGAIKFTEGPIDAMTRVFEHATGNHYRQWHLFCTETGPNYRVHFLRALLPVTAYPKFDLPSATPDGNPLAWYDPATGDSALGEADLIGNLHWLLPMATDQRKIHTRVFTQDHISDFRTW